MFEVNGIAYASEPVDGMEIVEFKIVEDMKMVLRFSTGEYRLLDGMRLLEYPAFEKLRDRGLFEKAHIDYGTITWCNGTIDIAPEAAYKMSYEYEPLKTAV